MNVRLEFDLRCTKTVDKVGYRIIINDELMTERDYVWTDEYVHEIVPLELNKGLHTLEIRNLDTVNGVFHINNITVNGKEAVLQGKEFRV